LSFHLATRVEACEREAVIRVSRYGSAAERTLCKVSMICTRLAVWSVNTDTSLTPKALASDSRIFFISLTSDSTAGNWEIPDSYLLTPIITARVLASDSAFIGGFTSRGFCLSRRVPHEKGFAPKARKRCWTTLPRRDVSTTKALYAAQVLKPSLPFATARWLSAHAQ